MAHQQPMFVTTQSPVASLVQPQTGTGGYKAAVGKITGGFQIVCGVFSIIAGVCAIVFAKYVDYPTVFDIAGWPIWGGVVSMIIIEIENL